ncbi:MAG: HAD-IA family hydrolase [Dehalococcoidia bacterium]
MIQAVFFDMDGVLLESFDSWLGLLNGTAQRLGYPPIERESFRKVFGSATESDVDNFFPGETVERLHADYLAHFHEFASLVRPDPDARGVIEALDARGLPTAIITNSLSAIARQLLEAAAIQPHALVGGDDVPHPKPAPDVIFRACEVLGVEPWDALVVGDSAYDKEAASKAGSPFAGYGGISGNFTIAGLWEVIEIVEGRG